MPTVENIAAEVQENKTKKFETHSKPIITLNQAFTSVDLLLSYIEQGTAFEV